MTEEQRAHLEEIRFRYRNSEVLHKNPSQALADIGWLLTHVDRDNRMFQRIKERATSARIEAQRAADQCQEIIDRI